MKRLNKFWKGLCVFCAFFVLFGMTRIWAYAENGINLQSWVENNELTVQVKNISAQAHGISVPIWTESKGQDDLIWYEALKVGEGVWQAKIPLKNHKYENGIYNIHIYQKMANGQMRFLAGDKKYIEITLQGNASVMNKNDAAGSFDIVIDHVSAPFDIVSVAVPVWSEKNGQDDIRWYYAVREGAQWRVRVSALNHHAEAGIYNAHVYYISSDGRNVLVDSLRCDVKMTASDKISLTATQNTSRGTVQVALTGRALAGFSEVFFPMWSDRNGQDDIIWYSASKTSLIAWNRDIDLETHGYVSGDYSIHAYGKKADGSLQFLGNVSVSVKNPIGGEIEEVSVDASLGILRLKISNVYAPFNYSLSVPVWSEEKGQDDICWYTPEKIGESWLVNVDLERHNFSSGKYNAHLYMSDPRGNLYLLQGKSVKVDMVQNGTPRLNVQLSSDQTRITATIFNVPERKDIVGVQMPIWSEYGGQDDLTWYNALKISKGVWQVRVNIREHGGDTGVYKVHGYAVLSDGSMRILDGGSVCLETISATSGITIIDQDVDAGQFRVQIRGLKSPAQITSVFFPVWTEENGQDDIRWYSAHNDGEVWYADIRAIDHQYASGEYNIHCYAYDARGNRQYVGSTKKDVEVVLVTDGNISGSVAASSWILYDANADRLLFARNPDGMVELASQTKIMTAMVVLDHIKNLDETVTMTASARSGMSWDTTMAGLVVGHQYTVQTLLEGLLVYSGGDCACLLAEYVAGSREAFVRLMNEKVAELGMSGTKFSDPVGLYTNYTTPREYIKLVRYADQNPVFRAIVKMPSCTIMDVNGDTVRRLPNSNVLVSGGVAYNPNLYEVDGMKTGTTDAAGYCLTASANNALGKRLIAAVFHSTSHIQRGIDARTLLDFGFSLH